MKIYVRVENNKVISAFGSPQDPEIWGELIEVEDDDPRYISFITPPTEPVLTDPLDKLKAFLAANPDVSAAIKQA